MDESFESWYYRIGFGAVEAFPEDMREVVKEVVRNVYSAGFIGGMEKAIEPMSNLMAGK